MKKIRCDSQKDVEFRKRYQRKKWQRGLAYRTTRKTKKPKRWVASAKKPASIQLPSSFDVLNNSADSIGVINKLRAYVDNTANQRIEKECRLDFSILEKLQVASALVLMAEIDMWHIKWRQRLNAHTHTWYDHIHKFLKELGFFDLVKPRESKRLKPYPDQEQITYLKVVRGQKSGGEEAKRLRENIEETFDVGFEPKKRQKLFAALAESFMNAHRHAYKSNKYAYWWLVAAYKKQEKRLTVAVYDRGLGIPETIRKKRREMLMQSIPMVNIDKNLIREAVELSFSNSDSTRTATRKAYHGHGLGQIAELAAEGGELKIASLRGCCIFSVDKGRLTLKYEASLSARLPGTLIEWTIYI